MTPPANPLAEDRRDFNRLAQRVAGIAEQHLRTLPDGVVDRVMPETLRREVLDTPLPAQGMGADQIIDFLRDKILPWPLPTGHARSYGWINSPPAPIGILAETLATTMNTTSDGYDHGGIFLLGCLSRWLRELFEFPLDDSMTLLLSGGSACNLNALTVARHKAATQAGYDIRRDGLQAIDRRMLVYSSQEAHSSIQKCVETLGLGAGSIRAIPTDDQFRARADMLADMIEQDLRAGHLPCAVVALAGSTNTGAIDPLDEFANICEQRDIWLHVDGAYGAPGILDPRYHGQLRPLARADTVTFNPHKWLMTPVDCGALLVKNKSIHREAFSLVPAYLEAGGTDDAPWPYHYSFQLTYADRSLKTWATLARLGRDGLTELVVRFDKLADLLGERLEQSDCFELLAPVSLSVVCFRYRPRDYSGTEDGLDELQSALSAQLTRDGEAHMPTSEVNGKRCLRACFMHYENTEQDIDHLLTLLETYGNAMSS